MLGKKISNCFGLPVQCVKGFFTALHIALKRFLLGVHANMNFEAVRGEEGLPTALLIANEGVFAPVGLLVGPQVSCGAVCPGAAFKHTLVALHLTEEETRREGEKLNVLEFNSTAGK